MCWNFICSVIFKQNIKIKLKVLWFYSPVSIVFLLTEAKEGQQTNLPPLRGDCLPLMRPIIWIRLLSIWLFDLKNHHYGKWLLLFQALENILYCQQTNKCEVWTYWSVGQSVNQSVSVCNWTLLPITSNDICLYCIKWCFLAIFQSY